MTEVNKCSMCHNPLRLRSCVEEWEDCWEGGYNPNCCRFPKSCSCTHGSPNADDYEPCTFTHLSTTEPHPHTVFEETTELVKQWAGVAERIYEGRLAVDDTWVGFLAAYSQELISIITGDTDNPTYEAS